MYFVFVFVYYSALSPVAFFVYIHILCNISLFFSPSSKVLALLLSPKSPNLVFLVRMSFAMSQFLLFLILPKDCSESTILSLGEPSFFIAELVQRTSLCERFSISCPQPFLHFVILILSCSLKFAVGVIRSL